MHENPATGEPLPDIPTMSGAEVTDRVKGAHRAFLEWRRHDLSDRAAAAERCARVLTDRRDELARTLTVEMGKPITQARAEIEKCAWLCLYFAEEAQHVFRDEEVLTDAERAFVSYQPLGVVLGIMPWNFPFWQVFRYAVPTLLAGNTTVVKHASNVPRCAAAIEDVFRAAGFPQGVVTSVRMRGPDVLPLIDHPAIAAVTLTGSERAGREVAARAGGALKKAVLELGGSDPYVVFPDADLDEAASVVVKSRLINSGQSCIAAKRLIVCESVFDDVVDRVVDHMQDARVGDPLRPETEVGPLARRDLKDDVHDQVTGSLARGATILCGGQPGEGHGHFYLPTVLIGTEQGMPVVDEEVFGPVLAVQRARDEREALSLANQSRFGLGAALFTGDVERGVRLARQVLEAGSVVVNGLVRSDPRLPFGGVKASGFGRELGRLGARELCNVKSVQLEGRP